MTVSDDTIVATLLTLLDARADTASICPSDVARALYADERMWRALMPQVRRVAAALAAQGRLRVTQGDATVDALSAAGPIRLRRPPAA